MPVRLLCSKASSRMPASRYTASPSANPAPPISTTSMPESATVRRTSPLPDTPTWRHRATRAPGATARSRATSRTAFSMAAAPGEKFDHCVLGEPSNVETLGDCIKVGRRGSLSGTLYVDGTQGHVAYPQRASNPVPDISALIMALGDEPLDHGSAQFQPSNLEFTSVDVGNTAGNVIPGQARAKFNIRFNDHHTQESLRTLVEQRLTQAAGNRIRARIVWEPSNSNVFVTKPGAFTDLAVAAIEEITGRRPELSTSGGTSDARFIASYCPVIEFGLVGQTMHQVDERTPVSDLEKLTRIYRGVLDRYFG